MKPEDRKAFIEVVLGFAELKGKQLSAPALELYWNAMQDWEIGDFRAAANQLLLTSEFMPTPADFHKLRKAGCLAAGEAFHKAMQIARQCSRYERATSGDPVIDAAAQACGGYFAMGMQETEKIGFLERRFAEHYESIEDREEIRQALPSVSGTFGLAHALKSLTSREGTR